MESIIRHITLATRSLRRAPAFTLVAILTLALGIGANTAIFSVLEGVLLRPLPYGSPEELVMVWHRLTNNDVARAGLAGPDAWEYRGNAKSFSSLVPMFATPTNLSGDGEAQGVVLSWVTPDFFDVLQVRPAVGRTFVPDDEVQLDPRLFQDPNATPPALRAVLSYGLWQTRYAGDPDVIGRTLQVNGQTMDVIGVAPPGFRIFMPPDHGMPTDIDVWTIWPFNMAQAPAAPTGIVTMLGRLAPGVTVAQAQEEMLAFSTRLRERYPDHAAAGVEAYVEPMHQDAVGHMSTVLWVMFGSVGFVLLIACVNVANLLLVRASAREKEFAIRTAMGSGRGPIIRQVLTEGLLLSLGGALGGILLATLGIDLLVALRPANLPRLDGLSITGAVLTFTLGASVLAALVFGLVPAFRSANANLAGMMKERAGTGTTRDHSLRSTLIVVEVAVSVVLLVGAGLMVRTFSNLTSVDTGFDTENVLTLNLSLPVFAFTGDRSMADFFNEFERRLVEIPGVQAAGAIGGLPLNPNRRAQVGPYAGDAGDEEAFATTEGNYRSVVPGYFEAMGIQLIAGRYLQPSDNVTGGNNAVAVIDEVTAERVWPRIDPVGREIHLEFTGGFGSPTRRVPLTVVGVVRNVRSGSLTTPGRETIYFPHQFSGPEFLDFTIKTAGNMFGITEAVRTTLREMDPSIPILDIRPMQGWVDDSLAEARFALVLLGVFSLVAFVLATVGLYGVISYSTRQRAHEIGIRMALGAEQKVILSDILREGVALAAWGVGVGIAGALLLNQAIRSLLFGVQGTDPVTYVGIALLLIVVSAAATLLPALRAAQLDPVIALRSE